MEKRTVFLAVLCLFAAFVVQGCASTSSTTRIETTTTQTVKGEAEIQGNQGNFSGGESSIGAESATKVEKKTVVKEERKAGAGGGIISTTFDAIGWVLALPFRIIGGIINFIF